MKKLDQYALSVKSAATIALNARAHEMQSRGKDVINFSIGELDCPIPAEAKKAVIKALNENRNKYTPAAGLPELREAVAKKFRKENGIECNAENVIISNGAKHSIFNAFAAIIERDDEVIIPKPAWFSYEEQLKFLGGKTVFAETGNDFEIRADLIGDKITSRTKAIVINSPCNPTGMVIKKKELEKIADIAVEKDLYVVSDEIYENFVYEGEKHFSIASLGKEIAERTITINGASKSYAMTGFRIGYLACNDEIAKVIERVQSQITSNPSSLSQYACIGALGGGRKFSVKVAADLDKRRKYVLKALSGIDGIGVGKPKGAFYVMPRVEKHYKGKIKGSTDFSEFLLEKALLMTVPGIEFGDDKCIRLSYSLSMGDIKTGMERLEKVLHSK